MSQDNALDAEAFPFVSTPSSSHDLGARAARHFFLAWRAMTCEQGAVEGASFLRLVTGEAHPLGNMTIFSDAVSQENARGAIAPLLELRIPIGAVFTADVPESTSQMLIEHRFERRDAMPAMAVEIADAMPRALPPGYEWTRIVAEPESSAWAEVVGTGFGLPPGLARRFAPDALGADRAPDAEMQFFGIRHEERLVAASMIFLADGLAGIYCVATLPEERGRGLGAYVTAGALRTAHGLGYRVGVLQASKAGHSVYRGLGFQRRGSRADVRASAGSSIGPRRLKGVPK